MVSFYKSVRLHNTNLNAFLLANELPVLKSAAIKFVMVFRSLLGQQTLLASFPHLIRHLASESVVVHSYSACAIEKILVMRDSSNALL